MSSWRGRDHVQPQGQGRGFGSTRGRKRVKFSMHFEDNTDDFSRLAQTCHIDLGIHPNFCQPHYDFDPNPPCHSNITELSRNV